MSLRRARRLLGALWEDTSGLILPYVTVMLLFIFAVAALAVDGARFMGLQTQLQKGADALAIAGAAELDRLPDALVRAQRAIDNLVQNPVGLGLPGIVVDAEVKFYRSLPSDSQPLSESDRTFDWVDARFVAVTVSPVTMRAVLPVAFFGGPQNVTTGAQAVAGNDHAVCGPTPLFMCNPFEQPGDTYDEAVERLKQYSDDGTKRSTLVRMAGHDPSQAWGPGDFGFLYPKTGQFGDSQCFSGTAGEIAQAMAASRTNTCVVANGINLRTGEAGGNVGFNMRFGLYSSSFNNATCLARYPPDVNVRKGFQPANGQDVWCRASPSGDDWPTGTNALPLDNSFSGNIGNGEWDCAGYWSRTYGDPPAVTAPTGCDSANSTLPRYEVYKYEISHNSGQALSHAGANGETGAPQCNAANKQTDRRIMFVAIVNCGSSPVAIQSNATNVPVAAFGKFFMTHPTDGPKDEYYGEFLGIVGPDDNFSYDLVQLYR